MVRRDGHGGGGVYGARAVRAVYACHAMTAGATMFDLKLSKSSSATWNKELEIGNKKKRVKGFEKGWKVESIHRYPK